VGAAAGPDRLRIETLVDAPSHAAAASTARRAVADALALLGVDRLVFGIHASAFPAGAKDVGYGSPSSDAGRRLLDFAAGQGFNALQLGPGGQISDHDASPYDGTAFSRNVLCLDLEALCDERFGGLLTRSELAELVGSAAGQATRAEPGRARRAVKGALDLAHAALIRLRARNPAHPVLAELLAFRERAAPWLELDALFEVIAERQGHDDPERFEPGVRALFEASEAGGQRRRSLRPALAPALERVELAQQIAYAQAVAFRDAARERGIAVFGDLQIGWSSRDRFLRRGAFAEGWLLGAPPSRTNPDGQAWGYPLLDPDQLDSDQSFARRSFALRVREILATHDGLRIDHPHGLVCPWIYRAGSDDPLRAVRSGVRAFETPEGDAPELRRWAIARPDDLDPAAVLPWADDRVRELGDAQVERYARLVDVVLEEARERALPSGAIALEVLSTCPTPLVRVLSRHGLGRFRVAQKADPDDPTDVYRAERAEPADWVMLGNHDTPPILEVTERWLREGRAEAHARRLAERLVPAPGERHAAIARWSASPGDLAHALLAELLLSDARNVFVYWIDFFGSAEPFNRAGVIHPDNWSPRLPPDFERVHSERRAQRRALALEAVLALALRARSARADLVEVLEARGVR
jgi:4-alpha-glucanotransferase